MLRQYVKLSENVTLDGIVKKFAADLSGATAIEYGLIAAGIAVAIIVSVGLLGDELAAMFSQVQVAVKAR